MLAPAAALCAALLHLTLGAEPSHPEPSPEVQKYLRAAMALYESLEFERVLEVLSQARKVSIGSADDVSVSLFEGIICFELRRESDGRAAFERALLLDPAAQLPLKVSPREQDAFEALRAQVLQRLQRAGPAPAPVAAASPPAPSPPIPAVAAVAPPELRAEPANGSRLLPWSLLGGGALAGAAGAYFSAVGLAYNQDKLHESFAQAQSERQRAATSLVAGECLIGAGGAAALAGVSLFLWGSSAPVAVVPTPGGLAWAGAF